MIRIAIDGPGGAGKSSVAKAVAAQLGIIYVDTGALYRNIGLYMLENNIEISDHEAVASALERITLELKFINGKQIILLNGEDKGDLIRTPECSMAASAVSAIKEVRDFLLNTQRETAKHNSVIMDGRDIGTVILPDAEVKIFLVASAEARAKRRYEELIAKGVETTYEDVYREMAERDKNDSKRDIAPCVKADDAILLDNSKLTPEQTANAVLKIVKKVEKKRRTGYMKLYRWLAPFFRFIMRLHPHNVERFQKEGGLIICANHISAFDVFSIAATAPRQITFIAKKELFSVPILGSIIKGLGAIKIDRGGADVGAIRAAVNQAKDNKAVAIFPQGHRYPCVDPATTPIKNGAGMIAYHSGCNVLPVYIKTKKAKFRLFKRIDVYYGDVIPYSELGFTNGGTEEYKAASEKIFDTINSLADRSSLPPFDPAKEAKKKRRRK